MDMLDDLLKRAEAELHKPRIMVNIKSSHIVNKEYTERITNVEVYFEENFFNKNEVIYFKPLGHNIEIEGKVIDSYNFAGAYCYFIEFKTMKNILYEGHFCNKSGYLIPTQSKPKVKVPKYEPYKTPDGKDLVEGMNWCQVSF